MSQRILIDTFNTGLAQTTGIGTYTRVLAAANRHLGNEVVLLTDACVPLRGNDSVPDPVLVFDHPDSDHGPLQPDVPSYIRNRVYSIRGLARKFRLKPRPSIHLVKQLDFIDTEFLRQRLGHFDSIMNGQDLFTGALQRFAKDRQPTKITLPVAVDVAHFTWCLPIKVRNAKANIYTLHDLIPLRFPFLTLDEKSTYYERVKWCCNTADLIVTVSEHSRQEITRLLGVPPARVINTFQSVDVPSNSDAWEDDEIKSSLSSLLGLNYAEYFLLVGAIEPRKNVAMAIEAHMSASTEFPLVVCGLTNSLSPAQLQLLDGESLIQKRQPERRPKVMFVQYLPPYLLRMLMRGARALLAPSITEGFGLSALEAMSFGTPVIASTIGALQEVCGPAGIYVDPYKPSELRRAIDKIATLSVPDLADLRSRARAQAERFSLANYCARLKDLYALGGVPGESC
jgi:glycosyltransferase involved in cell wall biosynthesis